jgi:hypothetical protein
VDLEAGMLPDQRSRGAGVVEVDVAQEEVADVREREVAFSETAFECRDPRRRAAVMEREAVLGLYEVAADDASGALVVEVD